MKINTCKNCGKEFSVRKNPNRVYKFCSKKCHASNQSKIKRVNKVCEYCGEGFAVLKYYINQKCCSVDCANKFKNKGKSTAAQRIRSSKKYELWRKSVFERDGYTCQICNKVGGKLNADHIKRFSDFPELRLELSNGRTLCEPCHVKTSNFGNRKFPSNLEV